MYRLLILILIYFPFASQGQNALKKYLPGSAFSLQFAGSTGFLSAGYWRQTGKEKIDLGLTYGYLPKSLGGEVHVFALKFLYIPFSFKPLPALRIEPVQLGAFLALNCGENLYLFWPKDQYGHRYYWWQNNLRKHLSISSQLSWEIDSKNIERIAFYFEANTNDLYINSYIPNSRSLKLYDIIFFGCGIKTYFGKTIQDPDRKQPPGS
jgi:hypothetical protein